MPKPKLIIGLVIDDTLDTPDGVQQYVLTLGRWLESRGHEVHYLAGETHERSLDNLHSLSRNIAVRFNHNRLSIPLPASRRKIKRLLLSNKFDILHVQMPYSPFLAGRIIKLAPENTAIVGTFHILPYSPISSLGSKLLAIYEHRSLASFRNVLAVSPAAQTFVAKTFKLESEVVPNAVRTRSFLTAKSSFKVNGRLTIVFLGRLVPRKGCQVLLAAVDQLMRASQELPEFRVVICGAGPLMPSLIKYVREKRLTNTVKFVGFVTESDKAVWLASADIAVFPSSGGESFGIVLVEAMASGKAAVIAGNNPGYASVLGDKPELLFAPSDVTELAQKLKRLLVDKTYRLETAAWGEKRAGEFDVTKIGPIIEAKYYQVASTKISSHN